MQQYNSNALKSELSEALKIPRSKISVTRSTYSMGCSINIKLKEFCDVGIAQGIAQKFSRVDRCGMTGEILSGGNTYVHCDLDRSVKLDEKTMLRMDEMLAKFSSHWEGYALSVHFCKALEMEFSIGMQASQDMLWLYRMQRPQCFRFD